MKDTEHSLLWRRLAAGIALSMGVAVSPQMLAQDAEEEESDEPRVQEQMVEEVIVTGSRLRRDTYSSIAPLQVITADVSREAGLIDAGDILQDSTASTGQQIDLTFQGFVLDNGPGSTTVSLRGLGENRTLVLINGRRLAPGGAEGAPFAPNLNTVPASLVQQYDILLDGASSIYGSDAIAGVANVIMRQDFDGFEIDAFSRVPEHSNGEDNVLALTWGRNFDRGFIGIGAEFARQERAARKDRPWTAGCERDVEEAGDGSIRTQTLLYSRPDLYNMEWDDCTLGLLTSRVVIDETNFAGSIYPTPGFSNGGWGNWSESSVGNYGVDGDGDGRTDIGSFRRYDLNGKEVEQNADWIPQSQGLSIMTYGEYTFEGDMNLTPYYEVLYTDYEFSSIGDNGQFFPTVPANNPFNLCNPNAPNGVDCGLAEDEMFLNPGYREAFSSNFEGLCAQFGIPKDFCMPETFGLFNGPLGPTSTTPIVSVRGDRTDVEVKGEQIRFVAGLRGDLPGIDFGDITNWAFDVYGSYSKSDAQSSRLGIRDDRINLALGAYSSTNTPCENDLGVELDSGVNASSCVPVNMFADSLYPTGDRVVGDFATQAERDYLFDSRDFDTNYEQTVVSGFMTGDVYRLPAGAVALGFGAEFRRDEIASNPDAVARDGLFFGFFSDGGAAGSVDIAEAFAEVEIPIFAGKPLAEELNVNLSTRLTDHEVYGENWTESVKVGWRPATSLLIRGTYGTAFRAPNLRELYLRAQSGFGNIFDPCLVPEAALGPNGNYIPENDTRDPVVLQNCAAQGVDPTLANNNGFNTLSTEQAAGGSLTLDPEESESYSVGFAWDQPFTTAFDLSFSTTYYTIEVTNTIIEPSGQFIVNDCYNSRTGNSVFCDRITRDLSNPTFPRITLLDNGFLNRDQEKARGIDFNLLYEDQWTVFDRPIEVTLDVTANKNLERSTLFVDVEGNPDFERFDSETYFPEWNARVGARFDYADFRFSWETRFIDAMKQDPVNVDGFSDIFDSTGAGIADTCLGPANGDVLCRDRGDVPQYFLHNASFYYFGDRFTIGGGIRNVFDKAPPQVDGSEVLAINNTPIGLGYDIQGRTFFLNVQATFGGGAE